jgi:hypothetical protein
MKTLVIAGILLLFTQTINAADTASVDCNTWRLASTPAKIFWADGYKMGIFMALHLGPEAKQISYEAYTKAHEAIFPGPSIGDFITKINLYCDSEPKANVTDVIFDYAKNKRTKTP